MIAPKLIIRIICESITLTLEEPIVDKVEEVIPVEPKLEGKLDQKTPFFLHKCD